MNKAIDFLKSKKISGADWRYEENYVSRTLRFKPDIGTTLKSVEKLAIDFSLAVHAAGPATVVPKFEEGEIQVNWLSEPIMSQLLPIMARPYSVPLGILADGTHKSISLPLAPHIMVAGTTGSGKSYWMHGAIRWALSQNMHVFAIDPKWGEFGEYVGKYPRFYHAANPDAFIPTMNYLVDLMNQNYQAMAKVGAKNIREWAALGGMTPVVLIIDELADAVLTYGDTFSTPLLQLAQKGRAAGIHVIAGTQAPTAKLLSGELKANFPVKIAFKTANATASRVVLDCNGAERLAGRGDGLCITETGELVRFKGYKLSDTSTITKTAWNL
jgi:S-DNA-T family DNA segregation ATPase FtsK/SpoIIIE